MGVALIAIDLLLLKMRAHQQVLEKAFWALLMAGKLWRQACF
jgi:hypothetical protein